MNLIYTDAKGYAHSIQVKLGSREGFEGCSGEVETVPNSTGSSLLMTRISHDAMTVSLTIPVHKSTASALESEEEKILSWFAQSDTPGKLTYTRYDGTSRSINVYVAAGYPVRTYESNTMCWIEVQFVAVHPYWFSTFSDSVADGASYTNNGDFPASVIYTATADTIQLNGTTVIKAASGKSIIGLKITVNNNVVSVVDSANSNSLYKCDVSSTFPMIPLGTVTVSGASMKITRAWANA